MTDYHILHAAHICRPHPWLASALSASLFNVSTEVEAKLDFVMKCEGGGGLSKVTFPATSWFVTYTTRLYVQCVCVLVIVPDLGLQRTGGLLLSVGLLL